MKLRYESLHNHTTASDGAQTYLEVLATAEKVGIGVVAFTDHDALPNEADLKTLAEYQGPVKWLLGCEVTSGLPRELGGGAASGMFHILGLWTDPHNAALLEHCRRAQEARAERLTQMVTNLTGLGFKITAEDCLKASGGESVGRPHIVRALLAHSENLAVIDGLRLEMEQAAIADAGVAMDYMNMMQRDPADYPYRLFLSEDAFVPGVYVDYLYVIDMDASVKLIREAGGVAMLAHWPTIMKKIDAGMLEGFLRDGRLDGVELRTGYYDSQVPGTERTLVAMAERTGAATTLGVDGHTAEALTRFVADRPLAERTVGQTARLAERFGRKELTAA
ncbi:MAG TPA: PHP domain-containing protein [Candidatus Saccharimonas sp.]|nr:PHP domain-containing protein [Candidatus Saccharimonas sp.]